MTLCVAWRNSDDVNFASDSRVLTGGVFVDVGIKLVSLPIKIISSSDKHTGQHDELFKATYGLAFSGGCLTGSVIREMLGEILQHLQCVYLHSGMTIERIMDIVLAFHRHYTAQLRKTDTHEHDLDFLIGGKCPSTKRIKVFKFIATEEENHPRYEEILQTQPFSYSAIGGGGLAFKQHINSPQFHSQSDYRVIQSIRKVINDPNIPSVGGQIQIGSFVNDNFTLCGVLDHDRIKRGVCPLSIRGVLLDEIFQPRDENDFHIFYGFNEIPPSDP